jgi:hypothetical protein
MNAFISPDRYFDPESSRLSAYFSKLFILIGKESLQYSILDTEKNTFVAMADLRLPSSPKSTEAFYEKISRLISEDEALKKKYPSVVIGLDTPVHTLVPAPLFDSAQSIKYLEFNFGRQVNGQAGADSIEELEAFNVYAIPQGLLEVVRVNYPEAALVHRATAMIRAIYNHNKVQPAQAGLFLNVREGFIDLSLIEDDRLAYFNSYSCSIREDILYYTLYTLEQLKLRPDTVKLIISGKFDQGSESHRLMEQYIREVSFADRLDLWGYSPVLGQLPAYRYQELYALALCGS